MSSTRGSWNGNPNGNWWGLVQKKGPWNETADDRKRAKDRGGYPHAGHADWYSRLNPGPYIQTKRPKNPFYKADKDTVLQPDRNYPIKSRVGRGNGTIPTRSVYDRSIQAIIGTLGVKKISPLPVDSLGEPTVSQTTLNMLPKSIISETMPKADQRRDSTLYSPEKPHEFTKPSPLTLAFEHPIIEVPRISSASPFSAPTISPGSAVSNELGATNAAMRNMELDERPEEDIIASRDYNTPMPTDVGSTTAVNTAVRHTDEVTVLPPINRREFNSSISKAYPEYVDSDITMTEGNKRGVTSPNSPLGHDRKRR
jgi:hypothetical protein